LDDKPADKIIAGAAAFWLNRMSLKPDGKAEILATMSPDENHTGDNDLYTNLVADWCVRKSLGDKKWPAGSMYLPKDAESFLTYDRDDFRGYKQAAAVLSIYPLLFPEAISQSGKMLKRFKAKVNENGPAMSESIHATIEARYGDANTAYTTWQKSWQVYSNKPLLLFSEKKKKEVTYFTTGAAGSLQTVLYGFAGLTIDTRTPPNAAWSVPLRRGYWLSCKPNLPKQWKSLSIKGLRVLGARYEIKIVGDDVTVTKR
jgi:trehalose/maltose hydrolase-like predicted phosphorylase